MNIYIYISQFPPIFQTLPFSSGNAGNVKNRNNYHLYYTSFCYHQSGPFDYFFLFLSFYMVFITIQLESTICFISTPQIAHSRLLVIPIFPNLQNLLLHFFNLTEITNHYYNYYHSMIFTFIHFKYTSSSL